MIEPVHSVAAMAAYALADLGDPAAISLAQNESAFPPSPHAVEAGARALADAALYPDPDWRELRTAIAEVHGIDPEGILCGAGSMELIGCLIRAFAGPGDEVLGTEFGYLFAATAAMQAGARHVRAPEPGLRVSVDAILAAVTERTKIVFVCNPGNPTGTRIPNAEILRLREALPPRVLLIVDQAYAEFDGQDHAPVFGLAARGDTAVTRTLSKAYGLAGARVGWSVSSHAIAGEVRKLLNPNNIPASSQAMAVAALRDEEHMRMVVRETAARRDTVAARLRAGGLDVPESATNFALIRFPTPAAARRADGALRAAGLVLRGMAGYGLPDALRATIGPAEAMKRAADVILRTMETGDAG